MYTVNPCKYKKWLNILYIPVHDCRSLSKIWKFTLAEKIFRLPRVSLIRNFQVCGDVPNTLVVEVRLRDVTTYIFRENNLIFECKTNLEIGVGEIRKLTATSFVK